MSYKDFLIGIQSRPSTDNIHEALSACRKYLRYAYRGEGLFANTTRPETLAEHVDIGKEQLEEIRRVMWRYRLSFIADFSSHGSFTIIIFFWLGKDTEWITARYPISIIETWRTVPPAVSGRYALAQALLAFLGVTQPPGYENHIEEMAYNEIEHERSCPNDELERRWDLGAEDQAEEG